MKWACQISGTGEMRNVYKILVGKPERKRPVGTPRRKWQDSGADTKEISRKMWTGLIRLRTVTGGKLLLDNKRRGISSLAE
jgi:hypothetical protein